MWQSSQDRLDGLRRGPRVLALVRDQRRGLPLRLNVGHRLHADFVQLLLLLLLLLLHLELVDVVQDSGPQGIALHVHHRGGPVPVSGVDNPPH